jgi:hypothetical protein
MDDVSGSVIGIISWLAYLHSLLFCFIYDSFFHSPLFLFLVRSSQPRFGSFISFCKAHHYFSSLSSRRTSFESWRGSLCVFILVKPLLHYSVATPCWILLFFLVFVNNILSHPGYVQCRADLVPTAAFLVAFLLHQRLWLESANRELNQVF